MPASYTTIDRVINTLPALSASKSAVTSAQIFYAIEHVQNLIDAKLSKRYTVPLVGAGFPAVIETIATDLAIERLLGKRLFTQERQNKSDWVDEYRRTWKLLDEIADGKMTVVNQSGEVIPEIINYGEVWSTTQDYQPTMHEGPIGTQIKDPQKIADTLEERGEPYWPGRLLR